MGCSEFLSIHSLSNYNTVIGPIMFHLIESERYKKIAKKGKKDVYQCNWAVNKYYIVFILAFI